ncbi:MAG: glutathione peroxidase [Cyanobacteriota bacterium]|jgi:glutathione peroxidase|nr:glutathione peroxidase [Cyanobacteriota bacterium]
MTINVSDLVVRDGEGTERKLEEWAGQVVLIVNVASRCGFTRQYAGLEKLQNAYGPRGFTVLAFPCNDFGAQEPGSQAEIQQFCTSSFGITFPVMAKLAMAESPFPLLTQTEPAGPVAWNFEKFLIGKDGTVLARFKSSVEPESVELTSAIEAALAA